MIGIVLAAGAGRRLRPHTDVLPKALLPVDGWTTILDIALRNLAAVGLREVVIVVGYAAGAVAGRLGVLERRHGVTLTLVHNDRAEEWNNAYSLWIARDHFAGGALLLNGDTVHPVSVEKALLTAAAVGCGEQAAGKTGAAGDRGDGAAGDTGAGGGAAGKCAGAAAPSGPRAGLIIAVDNVKPLAAEEMKVVIDGAGLLTRITKQMDPALAYGEYIGATLIGAGAAAPLAAALEVTWRRDPGLYYEDGYQEFADRGGAIAVAPIGTVDWVEVDDHADLCRARQIAGRCY